MFSSKASASTNVYVSTHGINCFRLTAIRLHDDEDRASMYQLFQCANYSQKSLYSCLNMYLSLILSRDLLLI